MAMTKQELLAKANKLENKLKKLSGKKKEAAKRLMYSYRYRANNRKNAIKKPSLSKKGRKHEDNPLQGLLPGFTDLVSPKVSELARELIFATLRRQIAEGMEQAVEEVRRSLKAV